MKKLLFAITGLVLFCSVCLSQTDPCSIVYKNNSGIPRTKLIGIHENLLLVQDTGSYKIVNTDKIAKIRFDYGKYWKTGAAFGAGIGFVGGFLVYQIWGKKKIKFLPKDATLGVLGIFTVPSAIIGGLIGMAFKNVKEYELAKLTSFVKAKEIKYIIRDHAQFK